MFSYGQEVTPKREYGFGPNSIQPRKTKELHPVFSVIENPRKRIITTMGRVLNLPFALAEVVQILSGQNDAQALRYYNSKILEFQGDSPDAVRFNAAYGERLRAFGVSPVSSVYQPVDQLRHIIETLKSDSSSRQAQGVLWHPYEDNYTHKTKDRACNVSFHAMIRNGKLDWLQVMRSNDIIFGLPYNIFQWIHVQEWVASQLGVLLGRYTLVQDSLHAYENQYSDLTDIAGFDMYDYLNPVEYFPMRSKIEDVARWEEIIRKHGPQILPRDREPDYWRDVIDVFNCYAAFKLRQDHDKLFAYMPYTFELRWPLLRWMVNVRWRKSEKYADLVKVVIQDLLNNAFPAAKLDQWLGLVHQNV